MKKNIVIVVSILVLIIIVLCIRGKKITNDEKDIIFDSNSVYEFNPYISSNYITEQSLEQYSELENKLSENGIVLENKKIKYSDEIYEPGFLYTLNGEEIQIYIITDMQKRNKLNGNQKFNNGEQVKININGGKRKSALIYDSIYILNCTDKNNIKLFEKVLKNFE